MKRLVIVMVMVILEVAMVMRCGYGGGKSDGIRATLLVMKVSFLLLFVGYVCFFFFLPFSRSVGDECKTLGLTAVFMALLQTKKPGLPRSFCMQGRAKV